MKKLTFLFKSSIFKLDKINYSSCIKRKNLIKEGKKMKVIQVFAIISLSLLTFLSCDPGTSETSVYYRITISAQPSSSGTVTTNPEKARYPEGEKVTCTALPEMGYAFDHWEGDISGTGNPSVLTMNNNKKIVAVYKELIKYNLNVGADPENSAVITINPAQENYYEGMEIILQASPYRGYGFVQWEINSDTITENPYQFTLQEDTVAVADFVELPSHTLTLNCYPGTTAGALMVSPKGPIHYEGELVSAIGIPKYGYIFDEWTGDLSGPVNPLEFTVDSDKTINANFIEDDNLDINYLVHVDSALNYVKSMSGNPPAEPELNQIEPEYGPLPLGFWNKIYSSPEHGSDTGYCYYEQEIDASIPGHPVYMFRYEFHNFTAEGPLLTSGPENTFEHIKEADDGFFYCTKDGEVTVEDKVVIFDIVLYNDTPVSGEYIIGGIRYNILFKQISKSSLSIIDWFY